MCARCEELEERVAWLESELGIQTEAGEVEALKEAFGITRGLAVLLRALCRAKGRPVTRLQILDILPTRAGSDGADRDPKNVDVRASQLRAALGKSAVLNAWGQGYRLSDEARARVEAVISETIPHQPQGGV